MLARRSPCIGRRVRRGRRCSGGSGIVVTLVIVSQLVIMVVVVVLDLELVLALVPVPVLVVVWSLSSSASLSASPRSKPVFSLCLELFAHVHAFTIDVLTRSTFGNRVCFNKLFQVLNLNSQIDAFCREPSAATVTIHREHFS